jgi:glycosyltransferase involved in cell wall biosynthesis
MPFKPRAIHQFHGGSADGDAITNGLFYIREILRGLGFASEIYCEDVAPVLARDIHPAASFPDTPDTVLIVHFSWAIRYFDWLQALGCRKVLVYHNITPLEFFEAGGEFERVAHIARQQLAGLRDLVEGALTPSDYNARELRTLGFPRIAILPLLFDPAAWRSAPYDADFARRLAEDETFNILFVGRVVANKCQEDLLLVVERLRAMMRRPVRLNIVGGLGAGAEYADRVRQSCRDLALDDVVDFVGKVDDRRLRAYFRGCDVYLCLSEHEGFAVPLIEAMQSDLPVVAYGIAAIPETVGEGGLVLQDKEPATVAALLKVLAEEPALRRRLVSAGRRNVQRFERATTVHHLACHLRGWLDLDLAEPAPPAVVERPAQWLIEGPFDSSYSLALVNRSLSRALAERGLDVGLHSTEGPGDYPPDEAFLAGEPHAVELWRRGRHMDQPDIVLRNLYPPRVSAMPGPTRLLANWGWEESGIPGRWIEQFNRTLDLITVVSRYVAKVLADAGVRTPIAVVGNGAEHFAGAAAPDLPSSAPFILLPTEGGEVPRHTGRRGHESQETAAPSLMTPPSPYDADTSPAELGRRLKSAPHENALPPRDGRFRFLHVSSGFPRKGVDCLIEAWGRAFTTADPVCLVLKTFPNQHNDVAVQVAALGRRFPDHAEIVVIDQDLDKSCITGLYRDCDALVMPSRGEGFGLPAAEAMLAGLPVIATGHGGLRDFCSEETAWLVDYRFARAQSHIGVFNSAWVEPDIDHLAGTLRALHAAPPAERQARCAAARALVERVFTWPAIARRTVDAVASLASRPAVQPLDTVAWVSSWNVRCGIASYARLLAGEIPAGCLQVLASRADDRLEPDGGNVVRCWNQGWDDPLDELFAAIVAGRARAAVLQFNFGFYDLAALGRLLDRLAAAGVACHVVLHSTLDVQKPDRFMSLGQIRSPLARAARLLVHGIADLNRLKDFGLVDNVALFPHGARLAAAPPAAAPGGGAAQGPAEMAPGGARTIACFGYLLPHKGVQPLIEAFVRLRARHPALRLRLFNALYPVVDSEREAAACRALIARHPEAAQHIELITDYLADDAVLAGLAAADLVVLPYQYSQESASGAVRFALASGRPVACTPLAIFDDIAEVVHRLPGTASEDIEAGLEALLAAPSRLAGLAERQAAWLASHDWRVVSARLWDMLRAPPVLDLVAADR